VVTPPIVAKAVEPFPLFLRGNRRRIMRREQPLREYEQSTFDIDSIETAASFFVNLGRAD
jgi:hypothetical protein